jgi:murein tripeptide amidase MpaA
MRPFCFHALLRRQIHLVAFLDPDGLIEALLVRQGAVGAELARCRRFSLGSSHIQAARYALRFLMRSPQRLT